MSKFVVAIFPDEVKASDEARRLKELASKDSGSVLKSLAVVGRTPDGKLHVKESIVEGASGAAAGALIGALAGLPAGGPAAAALGATAGVLFGISADLLNRDAGTAFLENVSRELFPGKVAIVAEVPEDRIRDIQGQMEAVGGTVIRGG
jgi:uncharacterized membrane protein